MTPSFSSEKARQEQLKRLKIIGALLIILPLLVCAGIFIANLNEPSQDSPGRLFVMTPGERESCYMTAGVFFFMGIFCFSASR